MRTVHLSLLALALGGACASALGAGPAGAQSLEGSLRGEITSGLGNTASRPAPGGNELGVGGGGNSAGPNQDFTRRRSFLGGGGGPIGEGPSPGVSGGGDLTAGQ